MKIVNRLATCFLFFIASVLGSPHSYAETKSDVAKEQRWAEQVIDTLFSGEPVWLESQGHQFLGLEMEAESGSSETAVIVVHGIGVHPNWEQIIQPVRVDLAENGWRTLSIQMPILANDAESEMYKPLFAEVPGRFDAAINHLENQGASEIIIVAHSMGAAMTAYYLANQPDPSVKAAALIGMSAGNTGAPIDTLVLLQNITVPMLDLYGSDDLEQVISSAGSRLRAASVGEQSRYTQKRVDGADHFFDGSESELLQAIREWLGKILQ